MKDILALIATVVWFALNIALWALIPSIFALFACSLAMGIAFFAGFFGYLSHRERGDARRPGERGILSFALLLAAAAAI